MGARENKVEKYLDDEVKKLGGITRKWVSPGRSGVPDRIIILQGEVCFVEVKTEEGKMSARQVRECQQLNEAEARVVVVYGKSGVDQLMLNIEQRWAGVETYGAPSEAEDARLEKAGFLV